MSGDERMLQCNCGNAEYKKAYVISQAIAGNFYVMYYTIHRMYKYAYWRTNMTPKYLPVILDKRGAPDYNENKWEQVFFLKKAGKNDVARDSAYGRQLLLCFGGNDARTETAK